jgi:HD-GYP domain-containing protein (c-di-GMP phosphodiesterase class II)
MLIFAALLLKPEWDVSITSRSEHFWIVSSTALAAAVACAVIIGVTESLRETRLVFLGLAFMSIAAIFAVHGLATPGNIHAQAHNVMGFSSWLSLFTGALFVTLSVLALPPPVEDWLKRNAIWVFSSLALALGLYIGLFWKIPEWLDWVPIENRSLQLAVSVMTFSMLGFSVWRYFQAFLFARLPSQWAMVCTLVLLAEVQVCLTIGTTYNLSMWLYHGIYAYAFLVLFGGWFIEVQRAGSVRVLAEALSMRDAIAQLNHGYTQPIADLVDAIEWKDLYTLGHVRRVASFALMIGRQLGLSPLQLRSLALAAQMHDVGKITVPDRILTKPDRLTSDEFEAIKEHVARGYEIAQKVPALHSAIEGIRHHHEKVDGSGYPDGLKGSDIPLQARIVAVADAFDAMTSGRVYQPAVSRETAVAELHRCAGTHFDPACVRAFETALSRLKDEPAPTPVSTTRTAVA